MKKIIFSIGLIFSFAIVFAQKTKPQPKPTQKDVDKAIQDAKQMLDQLPPEAKEVLQNNGTKLPANVNIDLLTNNKYKNQPGNIISTDTIYNEEKEAEIRLAWIGTTTNKLIGPAGGNITSNNGKVSISIPAGALKKDTEISLIESKNEAPNGCGNSFHFLPDGLVFIKPVKLTLQFTNNEINGSSAEALRILTQNSDSTYDVDMNTVLDIYKQTVTSDIYHFSDYGFASIYNLQIIPTIQKIMKGQAVLFIVSGWNVSPRKRETKQGKHIITILRTGVENFAKILTEADQPVDKRNVFDLKPNTQQGFYTVKEWSLSGDNPDKSMIGKLVRMDQIIAKYTAPKIITAGTMTRRVRISVELVSCQV